MRISFSYTMSEASPSAQDPDDLGPPPPDLVVPDIQDPYTAGIEVSNACRRFYVQRQQQAGGLRARMSKPRGSCGQPSLDRAMETLRTEMVRNACMALGYGSIIEAGSGKEGNSN